MKKILIEVLIVAMLGVFSFVTAGTINKAKTAASSIQFDLGIEANPFATPTIVNLLREDSTTQIYQVKLDHAGAGRISLLLKGPKGFLYKQTRDFHGLMIVSGFFTGEKSVNLIGDFAGRVIIGFEYPYNADDFQKDPGTILQFVRKTPAQIALAITWLVRQPWMREKGLSVMGVSLGGVFIPSGVHVTQLMGIEIEKTIFVCTGVNLSAILKENLKEYVHPFLLGPIVSALVAPTLLLDPKQHVPELEGPSLVIQTDHDTVIPEKSQAELWSLLKGPKQEVLLPGPHVNPDQTELISLIQKTVIENLN
jgi:pimeloyl-ACP methyl ester carboxylesterase